MKATQKALLPFALGFPEAYEDHPWGESVAKVKGKVFVFFGVPREGRFHLTVKLPESGSLALSLPFTEPTGYGLGKAGWVSVAVDLSDAPPLDLCEAWIEESYEAVAPKKLAALAAARAGARPKKAAAKKVPAKKIPAKKIPAKKIPAKKIPAKKIPAKKIPAKKVPAKKGRRA